MRTSATPAAILLLLFTAVGCGSTGPPTADLEANKALVRRFIEATNDGNWDALTPIVADDVLRHSAASPEPAVRSRDDFIALQKSSLVAFPDQRVTTEAMAAEGDLVAVRATYAGTNTGPLTMPTGEVPATGKRVNVPFIGMLRVENGQIKEMWVEWDNVAMLGQLGLFPPSGSR